MHCALPHRVTILAIALALGSGPLVAAPSAPLPPPSRSRLAKAQATLLGLRSQLGLGTDDAFQAHHPFTDSQGRSVIHYYQTHAGFRVWGGGAIAHVEPEGQVHTLTQGVKTAITLDGAPSLTADQAKAIALRNLAAKAPMPIPPKVEQVVFPTQYTGGLATRFDPARNREVFDPVMSTWAKPPAVPYIWAYEVRTHLASRIDGYKEYCYIIDGTTGEILRKWNDLQSDTPVQGTGNGHYSGTVALDTVQVADGTYALRSTTRGSTPNPFLLSYFGNSDTGLTTMYDAYYNDPVWGLYEWFSPYAGHASDSWGDGQAFAGWDLAFSADGNWAYFTGAPDANGQSAAVDAHFGLSTTWDYYKNVFGRDGVDGQGTSTFGLVHMISFDWMGNVARYDNAFWSNDLFGMLFGDGTYPNNPGGFADLTEIDITGHEMTHGVTFNSAGLIYSGESGGMNEGTSDCMGKMVQAYSSRPAGQDSLIPDFPAGNLNSWEMATQAGHGTPLRWMYKPSLDGLSPDQWYDGIEVIDVHFSSGPLNRMFYFLCEGASSASSDLTYSPYLPGGMSGIGNDKAARIWYKTLTEYLAPDANYEAARTAAIQAADDLYGPGSAEEFAVMNAFAAVNVGAAPGQAPRIRVTFPVVHPEGSPLGGDNTYPSGILAKVQIFPTRTPVEVSCKVENATNPGLSWSLGDATDGNTGGVINPNGTWTTPMWTYSTDFLVLKATSLEDPLQFAKGRLFVAELDCDSDTETDAIDLGTVAMAWSIPEAPRPAAFLSGTSGDWNLVWFDEAFRNAWPVK